MKKEFVAMLATFGAMRGLIWCESKCMHSRLTIACISLDKAIQGFAYLPALHSVLGKE